MKFLWLAISLLLSVPFSLSQNAAPPDLSDFTRSSTEHITNPIEEPFHVQSVAGTISTERSGEALAQALFEIEGPGAGRKIRHAVTDKKGHFRISHVPAGTYRFKATLDGFQSVTGTIVVSKSKSSTREIAIHMSLGV